MREIAASPELVAYCGLYCGACGAYLKERCDGCHKNEKASWCRIRSCCNGNGILSCASCSDYANPRECKKFNNIMSKLFGLVFRSDRAACIDQIKKMGIDGHAAKMAGLKMQAIKRQKG